MVRKHAYPVPDTPDALAEHLDGGGTPDVLPGYGRLAARRDPGLADQLRGRPRASALNALWLDDAPGSHLDGQYASLGEFAQATWDGPVRLTAALQERVPSQGGFLVPEQFRSEIVYASLEDAIVRPLATVLPVSTLRLNLFTADDTSHVSSILGGWNFAWTEESAALAISTPTYGKITYEAKKLTAYTGGVPNELVADAPALQAFLKATIPMALAWTEDAAFINGTGVGQPQGFLNAPCGIQVSRTTASKVQMTDILSMLTRILPQSMDDFIWLCSPDVLQQLLQTYLNVGGASVPTTITPVPPPTWLMSTPADGWTLLGRPLYATEHVPALGATGDIMAVDPAYLIIADRVIMQMAASSRGQKFANDQTEFRFIGRVDAKVWLQQPVTPANASATVSPVVLLHS